MAANEADILHEAYWPPSYINELKSFRSDHKQTLNEWDKVGKKWRKISDTWTLWARKLIFHTNIQENVLVTNMKFLWKLHGNFGCHGNRSWKFSNDISYESAEPILMKFHIQHLCDGCSILS